MGAGNDFGKDVSKKFLKERVSAIMKKNGVSPDMQKMVLFVIDNSVEYVDLCIKSKKDPDNPKVLMDFLISKAIFTSKMAPEDFKCAVSIVEFANGLRKNIPKAKGLIPSTIVASLTLLDLISMGNNCTFLQEAYYFHVLGGRQPHANTPTVRRTEIQPAPDPQTFLNSVTPEAKVRCDAAQAADDNALDLSLQLL